MGAPPPFAPDLLRPDCPAAYGQLRDRAGRRLQLDLPRVLRLVGFRKLATIALAHAPLADGQSTRLDGTPRQNRSDGSSSPTQP